MSKTDIRLGSVISFDTEREADIIEFVQDLTSQHKLGRFLGYLLRLACETPEVLHYREKTQSIIKEMDSLGISPRRDELFKKYSDQILELKQEIDSIYNMTEKLYTLALAGKALGLSERTENLMAAQFVIRHQLNQVEQILGKDSVLYTYSSNAMQDAKKKAEDNLDLIVSAYGDVFSEIQKAIHTIQSLDIKQIKADTLQVENAAGAVIGIADKSTATDKSTTTDKSMKVTAPSSNAVQDAELDELTALNESPFANGVTEFKADDSLMNMLGEDG